MDAIKIREIQPQDNPGIANVIRSVLIEHNVPKIGTAFADPELDCMFETYNADKSSYFVLEKNGRIVGGAGVAPLKNADENICELQKMYFLSEARGLGFGSKLIGKCLEAAKHSGFDKCYLETMPYMKAAQKLYQKSGFEYLKEPIGNTGHNSCPVWMIKTL